MSYSFGMFFKQCNSFAEAFDTATNVVDICYDNAKEFIYSNRRYIPSIKNKDNIKEDKYWLYALFNFKFIYWEKEKLLGLSGYEDNYPKEVFNLFDNQVDFQDFTDQDYEINEWSDKIMYFNKMKNKIKNATNDEILNMQSCFDKEDIESDIEYVKRSILYELIFNGLKLSDWLYDKKDSEYETFTLNAIDSMEKQLNLSQILKITREKAEYEENKMLANIIVGKILLNSDEIKDNGTVKVIYNKKEYEVVLSKDSDESYEMQAAMQIVKKIN